MPTPGAEVRPRKHYTTAEIEAELASAPHPAAPPSCQDLCLSLQEDMDALQHPEDYPANRRAAILMAIRRDLITLNREMKQQHCPPCG